MAFSSVDRDVYSRLSNTQYSSRQVSNGGGGSAVSSPAEESPEHPYAPTTFQIVKTGKDYKFRRPRVHYHECQKNHAASIGGHAVDGCGEFLPGGKDGTLEALKCAACHCHRNFHRREFLSNDNCVCGGSSSRSKAPVRRSYVPPRPRSPPVATRELKGYFPPSSVDTSPNARGLLPITQFEEEYDDDDDEPPQHNPRATGSSKQKRFRTKFTPEQKERMFYFAETLGWRISKRDEEAVDVFCDEVGVKRSVFKVWMHNNKHNPRKRQNGGSEFDRNCDSPPDY